MKTLMSGTNCAPCGERPQNRFYKNRLFKHKHSEMGTRKKEKTFEKKEKGKRGSLREERSLREGTGTKNVRNKLRHANLRHTFFSAEAMQQIVHRKTSET